jgi:hypothetical protein
MCENVCLESPQFPPQRNAFTDSRPLRNTNPSVGSRRVGGHATVTGVVGGLDSGPGWPDAAKGKIPD